MDSRNGHGSVNIQNWMTDLNLCRMSSGSWGFSSTAALRLSWFNGEGAREMDVDELYTIWLNVTASYKLREDEPGFRRNAADFHGFRYLDDP